MSLESAKKHLKKWGKDPEIIEFSSSSATVELAAKALGVNSGRIAKTISLLGKSSPMLVVASGDVKIDNQKFNQ